MQNHNRKTLDKLLKLCYNIIKIRGADKPHKQRKGSKVMKTKLMKIKEATRENISEISILDIQSATIYESATVFFKENKNAQDCFAMLANQDYTADEILGYTPEVQRKIKYRLMIDSLDLMMADGFIICYTGLEVLD